MDSRVFWLSYFKDQSAVMADDLIHALGQICKMNSREPFFEESLLPELRELALANDFVIRLEDLGAKISGLVRSVMDTSDPLVNCLRNQFKWHATNFDSGIEVLQNCDQPLSGL
jgi:hypothetical protein